jgi:hypothetical protein
MEVKMISPHILLGKEVYIYGKPALVLGLKTDTVVTLSENKSPTSTQIEKALLNFLQTQGYKLDTYFVTPYVGQNIEEYVSYICILIFLLLSTIKKDITKEEVNIVAHKYLQAHNDTKNIPYLGLLTTASIFGGLVYGRKEFEFLKPISVLQHKIPQHFMLQVTRIMSQESSKSIYEFNLKQMFKTDAKRAHELLNKSEILIKRFVAACGAEQVQEMVSILSEYNELHGTNFEVHNIDVDYSGLTLLQ